MQLVIPCELTKADLRIMWERSLRGKRNAKPVKVLAEKYAPGQLQFVTCRTSLDVTRNVYVGFLDFQANSDDGSDRVDLTCIPGVKAA